MRSVKGNKHTGDVGGYAADKLSFSHNIYQKGEKQLYWLIFWPWRSFYFIGINWFLTNVR